MSPSPDGIMIVPALFEVSQSLKHSSLTEVSNTEKRNVLPSSVQILLRWEAIYFGVGVMRLAGATLLFNLP